MSIDFKSRFAEDLNGMIELFVSLGYAENTYIPRAKSFDSFCAEHFPESDVLTETIVRKWADPKSTSTPSVAHSRIAFARCLSDYQQVIGKNAVQIKNNFTTKKSMFIPYIFTDDELTALFKAIDSYDSNDRLLSLMHSVYFRLTYTCGLRPREGRNLKRGDIDLKTGEFRVESSKHHISRLLIMSDDMRSLAEYYTNLRDISYPDNSLFFPGKKGNGLNDGSLLRIFKECFKESKPGIPERLLPSVRIYDLRHQFATATLNRWLDQGRDLNTMLPYLQTFMGHTSLSSTMYYIHLLPENLVKSAKIDWDRMNKVIPEVVE